MAKEVAQQCYGAMMALRKDAISMATDPVSTIIDEIIAQHPREWQDGNQFEPSIRVMASLQSIPF